ncbi:LIC11966 family surface protein [Edaphocola flava]|jgi:hypothetical protein|uniref:LIC11966 family surface protein n=1 Tax=Edaphocola flava TaxID=2499629 RepID=UPI00100BDA95|nr:hypothetical protein [Edaphocola flava]
MKKIALICIAAISVASCSFLDSKKATDYNNKIVEEQSKIIKSVFELVNVMQTSDSLHAQQKRAELVTIVDAAIKNAHTLSYSGDDKGLKASYQKLLQFYKKTMSEDYTEIIAISFNKNAKASDAQRVQEKVDAISTAESAVDKEFQDAQMAFAKAHDMKVQENELQQQINKINSESEH